MGILGTAVIANTFARAVGNSTHGLLHAVGSRSAESASAFGQRYQIPHPEGSYEGVLADKKVEAVYISLPRPPCMPSGVRKRRGPENIFCVKNR